MPRRPRQIFEREPETAPNGENFTLRQYIDIKFRNLERMIDLRSEMDRDALIIQTKELERRLLILNHAHETATAKNADYLPRSEYGLDKERDRAWKEKAEHSNNAFITADKYYGEKATMDAWRSGIDAWKNKTLGIAIGSAAGGGITGAMIAKWFGT